MSGFCISEPGGAVFDHAAEAHKEKATREKRYRKASQKLKELEASIASCKNMLALAKFEYEKGTSTWLQYLSIEKNVLNKQRELQAAVAVQQRVLAELRVANPLNK